MTTTDLASMRAAWGALPTWLSDAAESLVFGDPNIEESLEQAEGLRYLVRQFALAALTELEASDPAYPQLFHLASSWFCYGAQNPDPTYWYATLDGQYTYRLFGTRGTAHVFDVETWEGDEVNYVTNHNYAGLSHVQHGAQEIELGPNGEFEIVLSHEEQPGNWCKIAPGRGWLLLRQLFYDWEKEELGEVFIERVGAAYPPPVVPASEWVQRVGRMHEYLRNNTSTYQRAAGIGLSLPPNTFVFQPIVIGEDDRAAPGTGRAGQADGADHYFMRQIVMGQGHYECEPEEAVVLEVPAPSVPYWNYYLLTKLWEGVSWNLRQSSLNGQQAVIDDDGVFRAVIAHQDPGVPNWLDPGGHASGLLMGRLFLPDEVVAPTLRVVPFDRLRDELPATTPVVSRAERSESIRQRMQANRKRRCDF